MKKLLFLLMFPIIGFGQYTFIPDVTFEQKLINLGYDTIQDGQVLTANIVNVDSLDLSGTFSFGSSSSITDFTGLQDFTNLRYLDCSVNPLFSLDVSQNTLLKHLDCEAMMFLGNYNGFLQNLDLSNNDSLEYFNCNGHMLSNLDLSNNLVLKKLYCTQNRLLSLELSQNLALTHLDCSGNSLFGGITHLNLSQNTALVFFKCKGNAVFGGPIGTLRYLDIRNGNNTNLTTFNTLNNQSLNCISVDDSTYSANNWTNISNQTYFSNDCNNLSQFTFIPDSAFEQKLINLGYDTIHDGQVLTTNISNIDSLDVSSTPTPFSPQLIQDLTGIESCINLKYLDCSFNSLTTLDLSQNSFLSTLICGFNNIQNLNFSQSNNLETIMCLHNSISNLDLSQQTGLKNLNCSNNLLTDLNLTQNYLLESIFCDNNQINNLAVGNTSALSCSNNNLITLDIRNGNNTNFTYFNALNNDSLYCISVDNSAWSTINWANIDTHTIFSNDCNNHQLTLIPDSIFELRLIDLGYDNIHDGQVLTVNISSIDSLHLQAPFTATVRISDLTGIEDFVNLTYLYCSYQHLTNLDLSHNSNLSHLICAGQHPWNSNIGLNNLNVSQNPNLTYLKCNSNELISLDLTQNNFLTYLECRGNNLTNLDISQNMNLTFLDCNVNQLTSLDLSQNVALDTLDCSINQISNLDFSQNTNLSYLDCQQNPFILSLDLSQNTNLNWVFLQNNQLVSLDVRNGNNTNLFLRAENNPNLNCISVDDSVWSANNWTNIDSHTIFNNNCNNSLQYTAIPDSIFEKRLIDLGYDNIHDGQVLTSNISSIDSLNVMAPFGLPGQVILDLTGIEDFINLTYFDCRYNSITTLDLSQNTALSFLDCSAINNSMGELTSLNINQNIFLETLKCAGNQLTSLDLSLNSNLQTLSCNANKLINLDLRNGNNINLTSFDCILNDSLFCVSVDDSTWSANNWTNIDSQTSFSNDCNPSTVDIIEIEKNLLVYPNPTREEINISVDNYYSNIRTEVYDLIGNKLLISNDNTISLRDYARGIYIFKVALGERVQEVKVIKE